jgi:hypothetical protein
VTLWGGSNTVTVHLNRHDEHERGRLVIGCPGCIEVVARDQITAALSEWLDSADPWDEREAPDLPRQAPSYERLRVVYRLLRGQGYDIHEVRVVLALWTAEHA